VLKKLRQDKVQKLILIAPAWQSQSWYPELLRLSIENPILITPQLNLLKNPAGETHPLVKNKTLRLVVWVVSGVDWRRREYQKGLPVLSQQADENQLFQLTHRPGVSRLAGVVNKRLIRFAVV